MIENQATTTPEADGTGGRASRPGGAGSADIDWAAALATHDRWLRTAVLARVGERQAVEEVLQEVALAAVAQRAALDDPSKAGAWLYRIAVRQALLHRRRRGRRVRLADRYAGSGPANVGASRDPDPLDWLVLDERRNLVREAVARLPRRDAEVLILKYTEGWSYRELAVHLGVGESAVEARLHRARRRLRDALAAARVIEVPE